MNDSLSNEDLLQQYAATQRQEHVPVIVCITIVIVFGIVGNAATAIFYGRKMRLTATTLFLAVLSINDLVTSVVHIGNVIYLCMEGLISSEFLCKSFAILTKVCIQNSLCLLVLIGLDRYIRLCHINSKWTFNVRRAWYCLFAMFGLSVVLGGLFYIAYDIVQEDVDSGNRTVLGYFCKATEVPEHKKIVIGLQYVDMVSSAIIVIALVLLYTLIWKRVAQKVMKNRRLGPSRSTKAKSTGEKIKSIIYFSEPDLLEAQAEEKHEVMLESGKDIDEDKALEMARLKKEDESKKPNKAMKKSREHTKSPNAPKQQWGGKITFTMFMMTVVSLLSFVPYFIVMVAFRASDSIALRIAFRSFMLNSTLNPYVITLVNNEFRQFVWQSFTHYCLCRRRLAT